MVKPGAIVIDVGITATRRASCAATSISPASRKWLRTSRRWPGGVGPMTITMLLMNTVEAAEAQLNLTVSNVLDPR